MHEMLLPVLHEQAAPMVLCQICPDPGRCCRKFTLVGADKLGSAITFWLGNWYKDAVVYLAKMGLPYSPVEIIGRWTDEESGRDYVSCLYTCLHLSKGRCSIYAERPGICRTFAPGTSGLCCFPVSKAS